MKYNIKQYTKDECYNIAKQCENYFKMQLKDISAYITARENGWLETYTWFTEIKTTMKYDFESVEDEVVKYFGKRKKDFENESPRIYRVTIDRKWMFLFEKYFIPVYAEKGYWDNEKNAYEAALKCETRDEFRKRFMRADHYAKIHNWYEKWNLWNSRHSPGYWTYEKVAEEAAKYEFRSDFNKTYASKMADENGWYKELTKNMKLTKNTSSARIYCVYIYVIKEENTAYVGLTKNITQRDLQHRFYSENANDLLTLFCIDLDIPIPEPIILYDNLTAEEAAQLETKTYYECIDRGWDMLNSERALGFLGGNQKFIEDDDTECRKLEEIDEVNKTVEFVKQSNPRHPNNYWTRDKVEAEAKLYKTLKEFHDHSGSAYMAASRDGYLDEIADKYNLIRTNKMPTGYWTFEKCQEEAKKYKSRNDFCLGSSGAYDAASRNGWLDMLGDNIKLKTYPAGYWTYERCYEAALSCQTKNEFRNTYQSAYTVLKRTKMLSDFEGHWVGGRPAKNIREIELSPEGKKYKEIHPEAFPWMTEEQKYK